MAVLLCVHRHCQEFDAFIIFVLALFFCKNTKKSPEKKINVIFYLLRNQILPYKLHFRSFIRLSRAQIGLSFSKMLIFFAKRKKFRSKRKYRRIKKKHFKQKHLTPHSRCVIVIKVNAVKSASFTGYRTRLKMRLKHD